MRIQTATTASTTTTRTYQTAQTKCKSFVDTLCNGCSSEQHICHVEVPVVNGVHWLELCVVTNVLVHWRNVETLNVVAAQRYNTTSSSRRAVLTGRQERRVCRYSRLDGPCVTAFTSTASPTNIGHSDTSVKRLQREIVDTVEWSTNTLLILYVKYFTIG